LEADIEIPFEMAKFGSTYPIEAALALPAPKCREMVSFNTRYRLMLKKTERVATGSGQKPYLPSGGGAGDEDNDRSCVNRLFVAAIITGSYLFHRRYQIGSVRYDENADAFV
jgi:hypothetical protein